MHIIYYVGGRYMSVEKEINELVERAKQAEL